MMSMTTQQKLRAAGIAGIASAALGLGVALLYPGSIPNPHVSAIHLPPLPLSIISALLYVLYMYGLAVLGGVYRKRVLTWSAYTIIMIQVAFTVLAAVNGQLLELADAPVPVLVLSACGMVAAIAVGWNVLRLKSRLGTLAVWYGIFAILSGTGLAFLIYPYAGVSIDLLAYACGSAVLLRAAKEEDEQRTTGSSKP